MSRGYPVNYRAVAQAAVAAARPFGPIPLSAEIGRALASVPKVPAPPPALFAFVLGGIAGILLYRAWENARQPSEVDSQPPVLGPSVASIPGAVAVNSALTFLQTRKSAYYNTAQGPVIASGILNHMVSYNPSYSSPFWKPESAYYADGYPSYDTFQKVANPPPPNITVQHSQYYGVSTEVKAWTADAKGWFEGVIQVYRNMTGQPQQALVQSPARVVAVPLPAAAIPRAVAELALAPSLPVRSRWEPYRGVYALHVPIVGPVRGTSPMGSGPEVKLRATAQVMRVIGNTVGSIGEAQDFVRCVMYATGNTYRSRGNEKALPRWRWRQALFELAGLPPPRDAVKWRVSRRVDGGVVAADGRFLPWATVGARLARCLAQNWWDDAVQARQSQIIRDAGRYTGLTIGPLGPESIFALLNGKVPYADAFSVYW